MGVVRDSSALVEQAYDDPEGVLRETERLLATPSIDEVERCIALWASGLARRELGDTVDAVTELGDARRRALQLGENRIAARVATTLALSLAQVGRADEAIVALDEAERHVSGADLGHLKLQRGLVQFLRDDLRDSIRNLFSALEIFRTAGDELAQSRTHLNLGLVLGSDNQHLAALEHAEHASTIAGRLGQQLLAAQARHNVGYAAYRLGDVPRALREMAAAEVALERLGHAEAFRSMVLMDRAQVLLDANLIDDACEEIDRALDLSLTGSNTVQTADATLLSARCHLRSGEFDRAEALAGRAIALFAASGREGWQLLAELVSLQATAGRDQRRVDGSRAEAVALALVERRWTNEAVAAAIVAVDALIHEGETERAIALLDVCRHRPPGPTAVERSGLALVRAAFHTIGQDNRSARRAITDGLALLAENQAAVGAMELRAYGVAHGDALSELGAALALRDGRPRELLLRAEQGRGATSLLPRAHPSGASAEARDLLMRYRLISHERNTERDGPMAQRNDTDAELAAIESQLRNRSRRSSTGATSESFALGEALRSLGDRHLLEYVDVNDRLVVAHATRSRTRVFPIERGQLRGHLDQLELALGRLHRSGASAPSMAASQQIVDDVGEAIAANFLPKQVLDSNIPLVIVPTGELHAVPWNALPACRGRATVVAPSMGSWHHARARRRSGRKLGLAAGPGLPFAGPELRSIASALDTEPFTLADATVAAAIDVLGTVDIAHFACHGSFRADSPLFSALRLADGDLTFYDLEQVRRLPHTIVMSACNAGQNAVLNGGGLLGMASALIQLGVSSVIAPLTPVNDERSVDLMVRLHTHLAAGAAPADALAAASLGADGELDPTAASFICFGS